MHRCVVNMVVVLLYIFGPYWCMYVALCGSINALPDDGVTVNTETCRSFFNVNFNGNKF